MATVTGMTAAAMQAIRDGTIVSAAFDSANHLILTKYDGTQVDGGTLAAASTTLAGPVELATNAETQSGSATNLAVTPAGLASLPGYRVQIVTGLKETDSPSVWPYGTSMQSASSGDGGGWTPHGGDGTVVTHSISLLRTVQYFYENSGGTASTKAWMREYNSAVGGGGWTSWSQIMLSVTLNEANFTQLTALNSYPSGLSYLYYTTTNGTSWDFNGMAGTVETKFNTTKGYGRQIFTQHVSGGTNTGEVWMRTSDQSIGWSAWKKLVHDPGSWITYTPTWTTQGGLHLPSYGNATVNVKAYKIARKVDVQFSITFGSTTNFGSGVTGSDNWQFSLPPNWPAANSGDPILGYMDMYVDKYNFGLARVKLASTTYIQLGIAIAFTGNSSNTPSADSDIGGDVDSISPFSGGTTQGIWGSGSILRGTFSYESAS